MSAKIWQYPFPMRVIRVISLFLGIISLTSTLSVRGAHGETFVFGDVTTYAEVTRFTNENWYTLPHPKVATISLTSDGTVTGLTENGIQFVQYKVPNELGIRVERFEIQDHYHYIVEGEIADTFEELSALLAHAYLRG